MMTTVAAGLISFAIGSTQSDPPKANTPATPNEVVARTMRVIVLDPQGKPIPGAKVHSSVWTEEKDYKANHDYETDAAGTAQVELPKTYTIVRLWASRKSFVGMYANWEQNEISSGKLPPDEYTFRLESAVNVGGRILDPDGKPIVGANVGVRLNGAPKPKFTDGRSHYSGYFAGGNEPALTDADGRWRIDNVPDNPEAVYSLLVTHPDYWSDEFWGESQKAAGVTTKMLREQSAEIRMRPGVIVRVYVRDPDGRPIKDAIVIVGDRPYFENSPMKFATDADGQVRLPALPPRHTSLTVMAPGFAPQKRILNLESKPPPQEFRMAPGKTIRLRVVSSEGVPVGNASVSIIEWNGSEAIQSAHNSNHPKMPETKIPKTTNADGVWEWTFAPEVSIKLHVWGKGYGREDVEIAAGAPERKVVLKAEHRITGRVIDAKTGQSIPKFTVIPIDVFRADWLNAERSNAKAGKDGRLDFLATRTDVPLHIRIEATGYRTMTGREFRVGDSVSLKQDFALEPDSPITGTVLDADGQPAKNATVFLATATEHADWRYELGGNRAPTDAAGRYSFPDPAEPFMVAVRSEAGFAQSEILRDQKDAGTLKLRPWASIRGQFRDGGKPIAGATILVDAIRIESLTEPCIEQQQQVVTGPDGRFELARVAPGPVSLFTYIGPWKDEGFRSGPHVPIDLQPGQTVDLDLGGAGATVTGQVKLTGKVPADLDCTYSLNRLVRLAPGIPHAEVAKLNFDIRKGWRDAWLKSREGQAYASTLQSWFVKLAPDGSFRISGVPAGEYQLNVEVYAKPSGCLVDPLARNSVKVTVTPDDVARGTLSMPEITAEVAPVPGVGDVPAISFQRTDGVAGSFADFRGKPTVVHFWASWCGPCKKQLPGLVQLHGQFAAKGIFAVSLSLDDDSPAWQTAVKELNLRWPQGRLTNASDAGVSSVPAYWLLDATGKIVAKVYDTDELAKAIAEQVK